MFDHWASLTMQDQSQLQQKATGLLNLVVIYHTEEKSTSFIVEKPET